MAQRLSELSNVDSLLALRAEDGSYRVVVPPSLVQEVIDEAHQSPGTSHQGVQNDLRRLLPSYYWQRMKRDLQIHLSTCPICDNHQTLRSANEQPEIQFQPEPPEISLQSMCLLAKRRYRRVKEVTIIY